MKQKLRNLSINDRLHLEVSVALSFCIIVVILTLYLMLGYRGTVDLAPQSDTTTNINQVADTETDGCNCTKPHEQSTQTTSSSDNSQVESPSNQTSEHTSNLDSTTKPSSEENDNAKVANTTTKPDPDKSVSLSFSLVETQKKYNYTFKIENTSKIPVGLTLPSNDVLKYKISLYDGGVVKSGTIGTVDNKTLSIKPKEIYELNLDINNIISSFNEGVYLFEVTPTIPVYNMVKASVMFSITKTQA